MIFSNKNHGLIRQNEQSVKKTQKHDVNLQKNSTLYFQVGLILCLLFVYGLLEMNFEAKNYTQEALSMAEIDDTYHFDKPIKVYEELQAKEAKPKRPVIFKDPVVKDNDDPIEETPDVVVDDTTPEKPPVKTEDVTVLDEPKDPINIMLVEKVPIFPGCEKATSNQERRDCMSSKLTKFIQKKFDTDLGGELGLTGTQKIFVNFKINKDGNIEILQTKADHVKLEEEANRVVNKLPRMIPAQHGNKKVDVLYTLPIAFNVQN